MQLTFDEWDSNSILLFIDRRSNPILFFIILKKSPNSRYVSALSGPAQLQKPPLEIEAPSCLICIVISRLEEPEGLFSLSALEVSFELTNRSSHNRQLEALQEICS